jgi:ubiquinol-cytochrome c reductase cytochrome c1 subunit
MVRLFGFGAGIIFVLALLWGAIQPREAPSADMAKALLEHPHPIKWAQDGPMGFGILGTYDRAQLQRGFQVYKEVCSACHGMKRIAFRNLQEIGFSAAEVKALAKAVEVPSIDEKTGEPSTRKGLPSDHLLSPFANDTAARAANNNALPPDLSLIVKARHGGADYIHSLTVGYDKTPPKGWDVPEGLYYNPWFHSINIAMPPPLVADDQVTYTDGTKATKDQMSRDVSAFLHWASEPELGRRKQAGVVVVLFLLLLSGLAYATYQRVWADIVH